MKIYETTLPYVDIQNKVHYTIYNHKREERIEVNVNAILNEDIRYIYAENDEIFIEADIDEETEDILTPPW